MGLGGKRSPAPASSDPLELFITPEASARQYWADLLRYRELLFFLAWRDIAVRYKQTVLGVLWAGLQPALVMIVFTIFFGRLAGIDRYTGAIPYPLYTFAALLPWQLFARALTDGSTSLVANRQIITKIYFPRLLIPVAPILAGLVDFLIGMTMLALLLVWYGFVPGWQIVFLPAFIFMAVASSLAVALWLSAFNAVYRDVQYTLPFLVQLWLFVTPVAYPSTLVPEHWRALYGLNPMAGVIDGFRWALFGGAPPGPTLIVSAFMVVLLLIGGAFYFRRMESQFADLI